jgi:hypothetical protein
MISAISISGFPAAAAVAPAHPPDRRCPDHDYCQPAHRLDDFLADTLAPRRRLTLPPADAPAQVCFRPLLDDPPLASGRAGMAHYLSGRAAPAPRRC